MKKLGITLALLAALVSAKCATIENTTDTNVQVWLTKQERPASPTGVIAPKGTITGKKHKVEKNTTKSVSIDKGAYSVMVLVGGDGTIRAAASVHDAPLANDATIRVFKDGSGNWGVEAGTAVSTAESSTGTDWGGEPN